MELRPYQAQCLEKIKWAMNQDLSGNDLIVLPTGAGKSVVIAHVAKELGVKSLILQPTKEILEQNLAKLRNYIDDSQIGVYSASMGRKDIGDYTFATIQSIYGKPEDFSDFDLLILDEAHLLNPKSLGGMFMGFISAVNKLREAQGKRHVKVIGFTATPYRMDTMYLGYGTSQMRMVTTIKLINRLKGFFWTRILFNISIQQMIEQGYLSPLNYIDRSVIDHADIPLNISRSDFNIEGFEKAILSKAEEIHKALQYAQSISKSIIVFCSSITQAERLHKETPGSSVVTGKTKKKDRELIINAFKNGLTKVVFNVGVLTTGFDHPGLDGIVLLRPTRSIALYCQMLGRGVRITEGKTACNVIDMTSTVKNMGRFETIRVEKVDGKWELLSEAGSWHGSELFSIIVDKKEKKSTSLL